METITLKGDAALFTQLNLAQTNEDYKDNSQHVRSERCLDRRIYTDLRVLTRENGLSNRST